MNRKPKVMIFDDELDWAEQMQVSLRNKYDVSITTDRKNWDKHLAASYWDAIIVDVQILGSDINGTALAEKSILKYRITSPIIVISGNVNLDEIKKEYEEVFFDYISKEDFNEQLPSSVDRACEENARGNHLCHMLTTLARKHSVLDSEFPLDLIRDYDFVYGPFKSRDARTVRDLISMASTGSSAHLAKIGRITIDVINKVSNAG